MLGFIGFTTVRLVWLIIRPTDAKLVMFMVALFVCNSTDEFFMEFTGQETVD